eukprot:TRINITY_DN109637_c0_g1_i1.p1 TRINITY_DN109637_c0_g1~~TRINITY_DN109637_c0_g1_i1.p1  ORF type:complete len:333 (-),score=71.16 TRINITY_DN109637_c0_g1_i1:26-1024(-)
MSFSHSAAGLLEEVSDPEGLDECIAGSSETPPRPVESLSKKELILEMRELRKQKQQIGLRVRTARQELSQVKRRQKQASHSVAEHSKEIEHILRNLGIEREYVPPADEWRELAREEAARAKEIQRQIDDEKLNHVKYLEELRGRIARGGWPESEKGQEVEEKRERRLAADEHSMQLQAIRDYIRGDLGDLTDEELQDLLRPEHSQRRSNEALSFDEEAVEETIESALEDLNEESAKRRQVLMMMSNRIIREKGEIISALNAGILRKGLQDPTSCTATEAKQLQEILEDVVVLAQRRLQQINANQATQYPPHANVEQYQGNAWSDWNGWNGWT